MNLLESLAVAAFGLTREDALDDGICIRCKHDITGDAQEGHWSFEDTREYFRSALCPSCFNAICDEMEGLDCE